MPNSTKRIKGTPEGVDVEETKTYTGSAPSLSFQPLLPAEGTSTVPIERVERPRLMLVHRGGRYRISTTSYEEFGREYFLDLGPKAKSISNRHFALKYENGHLYIEDLGSKNGTYVNGQDIRGKGWVELKQGDVVKILDLEFEVVES